MRRARLGAIVIAPLGARRQRHQQRFRTRLRLQAEARAAIEGEIEFDVAAAAQALEVLLARTERRIAAQAHELGVSVQVRVADAANEREAMLEAAADLRGDVIEVVDEQAADTARLAAMGQPEILVAGVLEDGVRARPRRRARRARGLVPAAHVLVEGVHGREIEAAAEPPHLTAAGGEQSHVRVRGRRVGIAGVDHHARAHGAERLAGQFGVPLARGGG
jgi:hypothetical protein